MSDDQLVDPSVDLSAVPPPLLEEMAAAGRTYRACQDALTRAGSTVVAELVDDRVEEHTHYPRGDVYDPDSHSQYYFHTHRPGEYGHFHTFLRARGIPPGIMPAPESGLCGRGDGLSHLVAIELDQRGAPARLFTTNRWVTGESWYKAADVAAMLSCFDIRSSLPSAVANRWVTAVVALFRPQIGRLLMARDATIVRHRAGRSTAAVLEDRGLEVTSAMDIDVYGQIAAVERAVGG